MALENTKSETAGARLLASLRDPLRLRVATTAIVLAIGYGAIYLPLSDNIETTSRKLAKARGREELVQQVEFLRAQADRFKERTADRQEANGWVQHVLGGIRRFPLQLNTLNSEKPRDVGPLDVFVLQIELEGEFHDHDSLLAWLETNERLIRVESVKFAPARGQGDRLVMQLTLLGLAG